MSTIEEIALSNYQTNMNFLRNKDEALFNKLSALEILLDDGRYPQKYELEYKDDYFDVIELNTQNYLYATNSNIYSDELAKSVTLKKNEQVCESFYNLEFTKEALEKANKSDALSTYATIAPIISYVDSFTTKEMNFKKIHKFMFLGLGLALHLPKIMARIDADVILIIEDDLELFRLSLFTCNYEEAFGNRAIYFSIAQNSDDFRSTLRKFYDNASMRNHYLKFSLFSPQYEGKIKEIQTFIVSRDEKCYGHERILYKNKKILERIKEGYNFFELSKKEKENYFIDKPVLVLGAGPSLQQNIDWLKTNQDQYIIIAAFAALKTLYKHDVSPDIVVHLDEKVMETERLVKSIENFDFLKNSLFIFSASVPDILFTTFEKNKIYLVEDRSHYKQDKILLSAYSVGETAYSIPLLFNASETYLLGLDLALSDDGSTHSEDHQLASKLDTSDSGQVQKITSLQKSVMKIKGNFKDTVMTTPILAMSIPALNAYTKSLKSSTQKVFNLSDGARFENITPLHVKDVHDKITMNKEQIHLVIQQLLNGYSVSTLTSQEIISFQKRRDQLNTYYTYLEDFKFSATSNEDQFIDEYKKLLANFINSDMTELRELIVVYFLNTSNYVFDLFNTKELDNPKKHTKKMKKIVITQLEKIIKFYEEILLKVID